jgi:hypothetical protein
VASRYFIYSNRVRRICKTRNQLAGCRVSQVHISRRSLFVCVGTCTVLTYGAYCSRVHPTLRTDVYNGVTRVEESYAKTTVFLHDPFTARAPSLPASLRFNTVVRKNNVRETRSDMSKANRSQITWVQLDVCRLFSVCVGSPSLLVIQVHGSKIATSGERVANWKILVNQGRNEHSFRD